jgi:hypothetical protein
MLQRRLNQQSVTAAKKSRGKGGLEIRTVIVPTPKRAHATKIERPAGVLGEKSPIRSISKKGTGKVAYRFLPKPMVVKDTTQK